MHVHGGDDKEHMLWMRCAKRALLAGGASPRFRLFLQVRHAEHDPTDVGEGGFQAECNGLDSDNTTDVRELFGASVADCWMRGVGFSPEGGDGERGCKFFWRAVLGVCYFHSAIAREQAASVSVAFPGVRRVVLSQLLECVRFLFCVVPRADGGWRGGEAARPPPRHARFAPECALHTAPLHFTARRC